MVTEKHIKEQFAKCEAEYEFCWDLLADLKSMNDKENDFKNRILTFQERLAETLFSLYQLRKKVVDWECKLIAGKGKYQLQWFEKKIRRAAAMRTGIDQVIGIGRTIGDAFAYFFYRNSPDMLEKHLDHDSVNNYSTGVGEEGELAFVKKVKHLNGYILLYHGITNILRYGDFSFADLLQSTIAGIGELKSKKKEGTFQLTLSLISLKSTSLGDIRNKNLTYTKNPELSQPVSAKLKKQTDAIIPLFKKESSEGDFNRRVASGFYFIELTSLFRKTTRKKIGLERAGDNMILAGVKLKHRTLFDTIFNSDPSKTITQSSDKITEMCKSILKEKSPHNHIKLSALLYNSDGLPHSTRGTLPLFWRPIPIDILKAIYFRTFQVVTLYNPAGIIDRLQDMGFELQSRYVRAMKTQKPQKIIQSFDLFLPYITNHLQSDEFIIDSVNEMLAISQENPVTKAYIKPLHLFSS